MYLKRYHDVEISPSGVWRILKRLEHEPAARLAALQAPRPPLEALREAAARPPLQVDVKFIEPLGQTGRGARSTTSSPRSTTAPGSGCCGSTPATTRRPPSSSSTTCWTSCRSGSRSSRPTTAPSSEALPLAPARPRHRPRLHQAPHTPPQRQGRAIPPHRRRGVLPTPRRRRDRRHRALQRQARKNGRTSTTSTDPTAASSGQTPYERLRQKDHDPRNRPSSVAQLRA